MSTQPTPEWQPIATAPKDGTRVLVLFYEDCVCSASYVEHPQGGNWYSEIGTSLLIEPTHWMPLPLPPLPNQYEYHNPDGLTDEQVGVKDGWRLCLKTETEHEGCEWLSPGLNRWASDYIYEGESLDPSYTYRTRRPVPESSTEPKEGGAICAGDQPKSNPENLTRASNAAAGTSNPDQQAAPPRQESAGDGVKWPYNDPRFVGYFSGVPVNGRGHRIHPPTAPAVAEQEPRIYVASKTKCADIWRSYRESGFRIISTWIDEAGPGETADYSELAQRCVREVQSATALVLYTDDDDILKGAIVEAGVALAHGIPVFCVGEGPSISRVFAQHPLWRNCPSKKEALDQATAWNRRPAAPVAVGETPDTDADLEGYTSELEATKKQRDAALKASNEHFQASVEMAKQVSDLQLANKELLQKLNVATGSLPLSQAAHEITDYRSELEKELAVARRERDEARAELNERRRLMEQNGMTEALRKAQEEISRETRCRAENQDAVRALTAERDRLREENGHLTANLLLCEDSLKQAESALATAQVNEANLCCVIAAAFAETAKPLNASVEYDATPTAAERLKKVQEILASAIDAADHGARDYQAAQAEAAADKRRLDWLESTVRGTGASRFYRSAFITLGDGLNILVDVKTHGIFEGDSIRAALDAASATEGGQP